MGHNGAVAAAEWVSGAEWIVSGSWDRTIRLWDATKGVPFLTLVGHEAEITNVTCDPVLRLILSSSRDASFRLWDFRQPSVHEVKICNGHTDSVSSAVFMNNLIFSAGDDRTLKVCCLPDRSNGADLGHPESQPGNAQRAHGGCGEQVRRPFLWCSWTELPCWHPSAQTWSWRPCPWTAGA